MRPGAGGTVQDEIREKQMITKEGGCRIIGKYPLERRPSFLRMKNGSTDFGQYHCLRELNPAKIGICANQPLLKLRLYGILKFPNSYNIVTEKRKKQCEMLYETLILSNSYNVISKIFTFRCMNHENLRNHTTLLPCLLGG